MINIMKKLFSKEWYCRMFHTAYGTKDNKWHCEKCDITYDKKLSDCDIGPR